MSTTVHGGVLGHPQSHVWVDGRPVLGRPVHTVTAFSGGRILTCILLLILSLQGLNRAWLVRELHFHVM